MHANPTSNNRKPAPAGTTWLPEIAQCPSGGLLKQFGALGKVNMAGPITHAIGLVMIGLGIASVCTGFGIPAGPLLISAGVFLFACNMETRIRNNATSTMRNYASNEDLNIDTFNVGNSRKDFDLTCEAHGKKATEGTYQQAQQRTAKFYRERAQCNKVDVITIQEQHGAKLLKSTLGLRGFVTVQAGRASDDCAILLNSRRFQVMKHIPVCFGAHDIPIVIARDKQTNLTCMFVSIHLDGLDLVDPHSDLQQARYGDNCIEQMIPLLDRIAADNSVTFRFIGADMNRNPDKWNRPFELLEQAGYKLLRSNDVTNVNPGQPQYVDRELDFGFAKVDDRATSWRDRLFDVPKKAPKLVGQPKALMDFDLHDGAPALQSDHRPVHFEFSFENEIAEH